VSNERLPLIGLLSSLLSPLDLAKLLHSRFVR
jgi:hypothetical protein